MIVTISGKGGVGKTSITALLLDELARGGYEGKVLAVDADPATTLHLALGLPEPGTTVADVRDTTSLDAKTIRGLPKETTPADFVMSRLKEAGVITSHTLRGMPLDFVAMGRGEGRGCYCAINMALSMVLRQVVDRYSLVVVDNEAGLEHLSRYRLGRVDLFLMVTDPGMASWDVALRILAAADSAGMELGETGMVINRTAKGDAANDGKLTVAVPHSRALASLDMGGHPVTMLEDTDPVRGALVPVIEKVMEGV